MDQCGMALETHGLDHAERSKRIDEARCRLGGLGAFGQHQALIGPDRAVLRIHRAAHHRDRAPEQCLCLGRITCLHHHAGTFIANRHGLIEATRHRLHQTLGHACCDNRMGRGTTRAGGTHVGSTKQQAEIGRIDRRGLDANQHILRPGGSDLGVDQRQLEFTTGLDQRSK